MGEEAMSRSGAPRRAAPGDGCASTRSTSSPAWSSLYLLLPIAVILLFSFNDPAGATTSPGKASRPSTGPTPSRSSDLNAALRTSIKLAVLATLISTAIGTLMALALVRHEFLGRRFAELPDRHPDGDPGGRDRCVAALLLPDLLHTTLGFRRF